MPSRHFDIIESQRGGLISIIKLDYQATLVIQRDGYESQLVIETPFQIITGGASIRADPERPESLGPLTSCLRQIVESARLHEGTVLRLTLSGGTCLELSPDERFESWGLSDSFGARLICMPGGELAYWGQVVPTHTDLSMSQPLNQTAIAKALAAYWPMPLDRAHDVAFHLADAHVDWRKLGPLLERAGQVDAEALGEAVLAMLQHSPSHLVAAAHLMDQVTTDIWGLGVEIAPGPAE